ncbi:UvrD-helicase domain-containing protein [uncultured Pontibacter sp.]|uniref:UvrD-helicase domain-containing protein n=1 Tax=uncultured Pontibacter sp. TaxID=453356 RepID=UPI002615BC38|nr:UvrD-helicase domain-containing protein [uncultured Pontibacter sp.]
MPLILLFIAVAGYFIFKWNSNQKTKAELQQLLSSKLQYIKAAVAAYEVNLDYKLGYFTNSKLEIWLANYQELYASLKGKPVEKAKLEQKSTVMVKKFLYYYKSAQSGRSKHNAAFVKQELNAYKDFFDTAAGKPLDLQQRTAIVEDEDANLVIAGAGSGKTTTIVGKVKYLVERYKTDPENILLISFTRKSAVTLASRVNVEGVVAKTFHSFGIDVIKQVEEKRPSIFEEQQFKPFIKKTFNELIKHEEYLAAVTDYFANFLKPVKNQFDFKNQGEYIQYIKDQNFRTYKAYTTSSNGRTTHRMEIVKSIEECRIANFLLFNGINYEYEYPYEFETATTDKRQYKPDFTILQDGKRVYLEHQAISKDNSVPPFFAKRGETQEQANQKYWSKINWQRDVHKQNRTRLIETYSYEMLDGTWTASLTEKLQNAGIKLSPKSPKEIWAIINHTAGEEVDGFVTLFQTFITLMKSNNYTVSDLAEHNGLVKDEMMRERNNRFIQIIKPIYERYEAHLTERQEIDFSDMINKATAYVVAGAYQKKFDYIIIDEFQDISIGRYKLIKALRDNNPGCRLFCVGDDWQSIYRFTGSDITLFKDFERYFGYCIKSKIETTYRFCNPLINLSSDFILKNDSQTAKSLKPAFPDKKTKYDLVYAPSGDQGDTIAVKNILDELLSRHVDLDKKSIFILGRYSFDLRRLEDKNSAFSIKRCISVTEVEAGHEFTREADVVEYSPIGRPKVKAEFLTVHKSKGLEADIVIVINCNSGRHGFPSEMSDDQVLNLLLSDADQYENGEERRLFYVAMTRAKEQVYFVADETYKSKFITELEVGKKDKKVKKCPDCKIADLVVRKKGVAKNGNLYTFWGCTNFLYGCDYSNMEWDNKTKKQRALSEV